MLLVARYVGIPYKDQGREMEGLDCWGLVRLIYKQELGIDLPSYCDGYQSAEEVHGASRMVVEEKARWSQIPDGEEEPGDVVVMKISGLPMHVGVIIGYGKMIHVMKGCDSVVEKYRSTMWKNRIDGYFRHDRIKG